MRHVLIDEESGGPRYLFLVLALLAVFAGGPFLLAMGVAGTILLNAFLLFALWVSTRAVATRAALTQGIRGLAVSTFIALTVGNLLDHDPVTMVATGLYTLFFGVVLVALLGHVMNPAPVDNNKLFGAISVYLVAGAMWGLLFTFLDRVDPGSFRGHEPGSTDLMYFSLVTLSTLGYGDITPVTRTARTFAALEAVGGQVYLAVLVAWLVGMRTQRKARA